MKKKPKGLEDNTDLLIDGLLNQITPELQDEIDYRMNLASKIYAAMKSKGWSQTTFAEKMGKKHSVISRWLSGTHNFETDTLFKIQRILGITILNLEEKANYSNASIIGQFTVAAKEIEAATRDNNNWEDSTCAKIIPLTLNKQENKLIEIAS